MQGFILVFDLELFQFRLQSLNQRAVGRIIINIVHLQRVLGQAVNFPVRLQCRLTVRVSGPYLGAVGAGNNRLP